MSWTIKIGKMLPFQKNAISNIQFGFVDSMASRIPSIGGQYSLLTGVKNVIGGILAVDNIHGKCVQKKFCDQFAVTNKTIKTKELDPIKRSWVYKEKVIEERGKLRWIGDMIANGLSRVARRIGFVPNSNRRQSFGFMGNAATFAMKHWQNIPWEKMVQ